MIKTLTLFVIAFFSCMDHAIAQSFNFAKFESIDTSFVCEIYSIGRTRESEIILIDKLISEGKLDKSNYSSSIELVLDADTFYVPLNIKKSDQQSLKELGASSGKEIKIYGTIFPQLLANNRNGRSLFSPLFIIYQYEFKE